MKKKFTSMLDRDPRAEPDKRKRGEKNMMTQNIGAAVESCKEIKRETDKLIALLKGKVPKDYMKAIDESDSEGIGKGRVFTRNAVITTMDIVSLFRKLKY